MFQNKGHKSLRNVLVCKYTVNGKDKKQKICCFKIFASLTGNCILGTIGFITSREELIVEEVSGKGKNAESKKANLP